MLPPHEGLGCKRPPRGRVEDRLVIYDELLFRESRLDVARQRLFVDDRGAHILAVEGVSLGDVSLYLLHRERRTVAHRVDRQGGVVYREDPHAYGHRVIDAEHAETFFGLFEEFLRVEAAGRYARREVVALEPPVCPDALEKPVEYRGELLEHIVPGLGAEEVVYELEALYVPANKGEGLAVRGVSEHVAGLGEERGLVVYPRKRVALRLISEDQVRGLLSRNVEVRYDNALMAVRLAVFFGDRPDPHIIAQLVSDAYGPLHRSAARRAVDDYRAQRLPVVGMDDLERVVVDYRAVFLVRVADERGGKVVEVEGVDAAAVDLIGRYASRYRSYEKLQLVCRIGKLPLEPLLFLFRIGGGFRDEELYHLWIDGVSREAKDAELHRPQLVLFVKTVRYDYHWNVAELAILSFFFEEFKAVHSGHVEVEKDHRDIAVVAHLAQGLAPVSGLDKTVVILEYFFQDIAVGLYIVDDKH